MHSSPEYLALQRQLHEENVAYGVSGENYKDIVASLCKQNGFKTVLDYGCGKGTLKRGLPDLIVAEYDPAIVGKDDRAVLVPHDFVACTDVLEHIELEFLRPVLGELKRCAIGLCFVAVHTGPAMKILADGRNAHLIQRPAPWWFGEFYEAGFRVRKYEDATNGFLAVLQ